MALENPSRKFAILVNGPSNPYMIERYGGHGPLFLHLLRDQVNPESERWDLFRAFEGEFPEHPEQYDGFILTGSKFDAHEETPWLVCLKDLCLKAFERNQKILGICFGHQALSNFFGGRSNRSEFGWEAGARALHVTESLRSHFAFRDLIKPGGDDDEPLHILESHQDRVIDLPPSASLLASSPRCPIEMYAIDNRVLCMQGHPEFSADIVEQAIEMRTAFGVFTREFADCARQSIGAHPTRPDFWRAALCRFLKTPHQRVSDVHL